MFFSIIMNHLILIAKCRFLECFSLRFFPLCSSNEFFEIFTRTNYRENCYVKVKEVICVLKCPSLKDFSLGFPPFQYPEGLHRLQASVPARGGTEDLQTSPERNESLIIKDGRNWNDGRLKREKIRWDLRDKVLIHSVRALKTANLA
jgi:hypothetical protein